MKYTAIQRLWRLLNQYKTELKQIYGYAIFIGIVNLTLPLGIQAIINYLQTGELTFSWVVLVSFVLVGITITGTLQAFQLRVVENIQQKIFASSAFEFAYRIPKIKVTQLDKVHAPELMNRFFDTLTLQKGLPKILIDFSLAAFQIVFGLVLLAVYSPFFIILGLSMALVIWLVAKLTGGYGMETSLKESKHKYRLVHWLEEIATVNRSFKLNGSNSFHLDKTDGIVTDYLTCRESHFQVLISQFRYFIAFKALVAAALLLFGGYLVFQDQMNIGQFVAAEIIIILILNSVEKAVSTVETIYDVLTALEKIGHIADLDLENETGQKHVESDLALAIKADKVEYQFSGEKTRVISDMSFEIAPGANVRIVGESGSGKTLLMQIMAGLYTTKRGALYVNSTLVENYDKNDLYQHISVLFTTNQLFEATFLENITMGRNVNGDYLNEILAMLGLDVYFAQQANGLDSWVDSAGRRLPRSIIQKVLIARALVTKPKLLLLEDPLQFIHETDKKSIIDYITHPDRNCTVVVVADYQYWDEKCTQVIALN